MMQKEKEFPCLLEGLDYAWEKLEKGVKIWRSYHCRKGEIQARPIHTTKVPSLLMRSNKRVVKRWTVSRNEEEGLL